MSRSREVTIVGAGLAGCELALQLASRGHPVCLVEQKPLARPLAHTTDQLAELVCSNSLRSDATKNAVGLLKEEMRRAGSFVMQAAEQTRVPAGSALAVDRTRFSALLTQWIERQPRITRRTELVRTVPACRPLVLATGPLTGEALALELERLLGSEHLEYYDAIAPVVTADSLDHERIFAASRWDKGDDPESRAAYLNCPLDKPIYQAFVQALREAKVVQPRPFEQNRFFEGCLPIEVMASRGERTLAFGPLKPTGLTDPRTGRWPYAVLQLRPEDLAATAYNLVGCQTRLTVPEQARIFRMVPGLDHAEFERWGAVHRNTFLDAPRVLDGFFRLRSEPELFFAGQLTGVEGYVESAASGMIVAWLIDDLLAERPLELPPASTCLGGLARHLSRTEPGYQPSNVTFAMLEPLSGPTQPRHRTERVTAWVERSLCCLSQWLANRALDSSHGSS